MYVINDNEDLIYEVRIDKRDVVDRGNTSSYVEVKLYLVCGKDWVEVDSYGGQMGWLPPEYFSDRVQYDSIVCYFYEEGILHALEENGYREMKKLPKIEKPKE